jgi:hypothetical protein
LNWGLPILKLDWLYESIKKGYFIDYENYYLMKRKNIIEEEEEEEQENILSDEYDDADLYGDMSIMKNNNSKNNENFNPNIIEETIKKVENNEKNIENNKSNLENNKNNKKENKNKKQKDNLIKVKLEKDQNKDEPKNFLSDLNDFNFEELSKNIENSNSGDSYETNFDSIPPLPTNFNKRRIFKKNLENENFTSTQRIYIRDDSQLSDKIIDFSEEILNPSFNKSKDENFIESQVVKYDNKVINHHKSMLNGKKIFLFSGLSSEQVKSYSKCNFFQFFLK